MKENYPKKEELENYSKYIVSAIAYEDTSKSIEDKIDLLALIHANREKIIMSQTFFEEDCLFRILNWVYDQRENFTQENFNFLKLNDLVLNALLIFETFPLNIDFFAAKLFAKKIYNLGNLLKNVRIEYYNRIRKLYAYWQKNFKLIEKQFLKRKRGRDDLSSIESDTVEASEDTNYSRRDSERKKKGVSWKEDLVETVYFSIENEPYKFI